MGSLHLAVAQPKLVAHDVAANAHAHASLVTNAHAHASLVTNAHAHASLVTRAGARVVVFPELSLTGYELDAQVLALDDPRLAPLIDACAATGTLALAGAPIGGPAGGGSIGGPHIAMLAITGSGVTVAYRKQWLGDVEAQRFSPGPAPAVIEVDGWRLGLAICKDTGIPQHASDTCALGIDAYVAGTVKHAHEAALQAERARLIATSHHVWVAVASCAGPTGGGFTDTAAGSAIWSPDGSVVAHAGPSPGSFTAATLLR